MRSAYRIETFHDIVRILREHPEWLEEMRKLILTGELLALPEKFERFKEEFDRFREEEFLPLKEKVDKIEQDVGELKGDNLERRVRERAGAYFSKIFKRCKVITNEELLDILEEAFERGLISEEERESALQADVVIIGSSREVPGQELVVVGEVSVKVDRKDIERAIERSRILEKAMKIRSYAVALGRNFTKGAQEKAKEYGVLLRKI